jgi:hypothetical protein
MLDSNEITQLFTCSDMQFRAKYNKMLFSLFLEEPFTVTFGEGAEMYTHMIVMADTDGTFPPKSVFVLFIILKHKWHSVACKDTEDMLGKLREAETPIKAIHEAIVCGTHITFYHYNCQEGVFASKSQEQMSSDLNLTEEDGAVQMVKVVEEVKNICQKLVDVFKLENFWKDRAWISHS